MYRKGNTYMISQAQSKLFCKDDISLIENYDIKEWMGAREVERVLEINQSHITQCCKGNRKSSGGFIWRYAED